MTPTGNRRDNPVCSLAGRFEGVWTIYALGWDMTRFFARLLAFILAVTFLAIALVLIVNIRPESAGGYGLIAGLLLCAFLIPAMIYKAMMGKWKRDHRADERVGAGLAMGAAVTRRRNDDADDIDLI